MLPYGFNGVQYRLTDNWFEDVDITKFNSRPIKYLEIGAFYGANVISVANTYASHPESSLYVIDPWEDYDEYPEYKGEQPHVYSNFLNNINLSGHKDKINVRRGYSRDEVPKFDDDFFDLIYIDGNHEPEYVLEDAVLTFRKLKKGGVMIFDDYGWGGPDLTMRGIDGFLSGYHKRIKQIGLKQSQLFVEKLR
jgi:predicted O-methyltransferase YrrM